ERVDGAPPGRGGQPGAWVARHALPGPRVQGRHVGVLNAFLGEIDVTGDARRRGEDEGPLATVRVGDGGGGVVPRTGVVSRAALVPARPSPPAGLGPAMIPRCRVHARRAPASAVLTRWGRP